MTILLFMLASSLVAADDFAPVSTKLAGDAVINWTELLLTCSAEAQPVAGTKGIIEVESIARKDLGPRMLRASGEVQVESGLTVEELISSGTPLGRHIDEETSSWHVVEARYHTSGKVEIDGELDIGSWLRPFVTRVAFEGRPEESYKSEYSGFLIDVRGLGAEGALAPRIFSEAGDELYKIEMISLKIARRLSPVVYVSDPADPRASSRAGENPLILRAAKVKDDVDIILSKESADRFAKESQDPSLLAAAKVVLVLDP